MGRSFSSTISSSNHSLIFFLDQATLPWFPRAYHELRKEEFRFKEQYDESRAPVLTPSPANLEEIQTFDEIDGDTGIMDETIDLGGEEEVISSALIAGNMLKEIMEACETKEDFMTHDLLQVLTSSHPLFLSYFLPLLGLDHCGAGKDCEG